MQKGTTATKDYKELQVLASYYNAFLTTKQLSEFFFFLCCVFIAWGLYSCGKWERSKERGKELLFCLVAFVFIKMSQIYLPKHVQPLKSMVGFQLISMGFGSGP